MPYYEAFTLLSGQRQYTDDLFAIPLPVSEIITLGLVYEYVPGDDLEMFLYLLVEMDKVYINVTSEARAEEIKKRRQEQERRENKRRGG